MSTQPTSRRMNQNELQSFGEQIDQLQIAYDQATRRGNLVPIEHEGRTYGNAELRSKLQQMRQTLAIEVAQIRRDKQAEDAKQMERFVDEDGSIKLRSRLRANTPAVDGNSALVELFGERKYAALTPQQKEAGLATSLSDVDALDPKMYFGRGSDSKKAQSLATANPARYRLLRARAVAEGIL